MSPNRWGECSGGFLIARDDQVDAEFFRGDIAVVIGIERREIDAGCRGFFDDVGDKGYFIGMSCEKIRDCSVAYQRAGVVPGVEVGRPRATEMTVVPPWADSIVNVFLD